MIEILQSCGLGILVGFLFSVVGLKSPSPDNWASVVGIVGIFIGWLIGENIK